MGKCIDHLEREKRESAKWCAVETLYFPFTEYNIDKVPVDVVAFLVVNHVNIGVLCYVYGKVTDLENS